MLRLDTVFTAETAVAAMISAIIAACEMNSSKKLQKQMHEEAVKERTIQAYAFLQKEVLDKFVSFSVSEMKDIATAMDEEEYHNDSEMMEVKLAYHDCRALIAKIEHFAVGVLDNIYDIYALNELGGPHLISLYKKVEPIIERVRQSSNNTTPYMHFDILVYRLKLINKSTSSRA